MSAGEQDGQRQVDDALLSENDGADLGPGRGYPLEGDVDVPSQQARLGGIGRAHRVVPLVTTARRFALALGALHWAGASFQGKPEPCQ